MIGRPDSIKSHPAQPTTGVGGGHDHGVFLRRGAHVVAAVAVVRLLALGGALGHLLVAVVAVAGRLAAEEFFEALLERVKNATELLPKRPIQTKDLCGIK